MFKAHIIYSNYSNTTTINSAQSVSASFSFTVVVHSPLSSASFPAPAVVFNDKALKTLRTLPAQHPTADRNLKQLDGEHSGAFSS